jgi:hypothetical protein
MPYYANRKKNGKRKTSQDSLDGRFRSLQSRESWARKRTKPLMNQDKVLQDVNNGRCEAVNCDSPAEIQIEVKVGQLGNISLSLCNDCVHKFRDEKK